MAVILLTQPRSADDTAHFLRVALGGGVPANFTARFSNFACRCSTATVDRKISFAAPSRQVAPAPWAISSRAWGTKPAPTTSLS
jgi:hypothetical protein